MEKEAKWRMQAHLSLKQSLKPMMVYSFSQQQYPRLLWA
jgi:hypothetical protein